MNTNEIAHIPVVGFTTKNGLSVASWSTDPDFFSGTHLEVRSHGGQVLFSLDTKTLSSNPVPPIHTLFRLIMDESNPKGEAVVRTANRPSGDVTIFCGRYKDSAIDTDFGEYIRVEFSDQKYFFWDLEEWREDPALVIGAIINVCAGIRFEETT